MAVFRQIWSHWLWASEYKSMQQFDLQFSFFAVVDNFTFMPNVTSFTSRPPALKNSFKCNSHIRLEWYNVGDVRAVTGQRQRRSGSRQTQCNIRSGINVMSKLLSSYTTLYNKALWLAFPSHLVYFNQSEGFIVAKFIALVLEYSAGVQVYPKNNE